MKNTATTENLLSVLKIYLPKKYAEDIQQQLKEEKIIISTRQIQRIVNGESKDRDGILSKAIKLAKTEQRSITKNLNEIKLLKLKSQPLIKK